MSKTYRAIMFAAVFGLGLSTMGGSCEEEREGVDAPVVETTTAARDGRWAVPVEKPGLPNLHRMNDGLFRGAQPEPAGFRELKKMGVKTVVNLRSMHSDLDEMREAGIEEGDFNYVAIPLFAWNARDEHVIRFLKVVTDPANQPVFFHCQHGADRTGTMAAAYRVVVEGWSREDALREMTDGGYNFHGVWVNLLDYMKSLDVEKIEKGAGLK